MKCEETGDLLLGNGDDEKAINLKRRPRSKSECNLWFDLIFVVNKYLGTIVLYYFPTSDT